MFRVAILDSDRESLEAAASMVRSFGWSSELSVSCYSSIEGCRAGAKNASNVMPMLCDMVFIDVNFDGVPGRGIEFAKGMQATSYVSPQIVFLVSDMIDIPRLYDVDHVFTCPKPLRERDVHAAVETAMAQDIVRAGRPFAVRVSGNYLQLLPQQISYIESDRRKVRIHHTTAGEIEAYASMSSLADLLSPLFLQCHKSFLINLSYVKSLRHSDILLLDDVSVPVSQKRRAQVKGDLAQYLSNRFVGGERQS